MLLTAFAITTVAILLVAASGPVQPSLATTATPSPSFKWGDTDCNGAIDLQDVIRVLSRAAGLQVDPACDGVQSPGEPDPPANTSVNIGVDPAEVSIPAGETRSVNIVANVTSGLIGSWLVTVQYDPAVVTPIDCSGACNVNFAPDKVGMANALSNGISGVSVLASVTFEARGQTGRQSALSVTAPGLNDADGNPLSATLSDGAITVSVSREDVNCRGGITVQDALDLISYLAGLPATGHTSGCPALGE
jgi:hypothetical protein